MERNRVNIAIRSKDGEDGSEGIVRGISFYDHLRIRYPVSKNRSMSKFFLIRKLRDSSCQSSKKSFSG